MRRCRYDHRPSKSSGWDSNPHFSVRDPASSIVSLPCFFKLERESELDVVRCLYQLGYRSTWCTGKGSNLHCHVNRLSLTFIFSFALAGTRSLKPGVCGMVRRGGRYALPLSHHLKLTPRLTSLDQPRRKEKRVSPTCIWVTLCWLASSTACLIASNNSSTRISHLSRWSWLTAPENLVLSHRPTTSSTV